MARDWWEDPDCPPVPDPPKVPLTSETSCHTFWKGDWNVVSLFINQGALPKWTPLALRVTLTTKARAVKDVWVQFQRITASGASEGAPYDFYVTYIPANTVMTLDGIRDTMRMSKGSSTVEAGHLVYQNRHGHVFRWPDIDCGGTWVVKLRFPKTLPVDAVLMNARAAVKYA